MITIEEKAKRYDEAIEKAKSKIKDDKDHVLYEDDIIDLFPELKESEKSKKWILEYLYDGLRKSDEQFKDQFKAAIAWFEEQGEQKPVEWSEEDEKTIHLACEFIRHHSNRNDSINGIDCPILIERLKSLRPQNTWKPSEGQMELLREVQQALLGKDCHNRFVDFMYELKRLREE